MTVHDGRGYQFGDFTLDVDRESLRCADAELRLRPQSFEVLRYLVERHGRLVPKDELLAAVWGETVVTEGSLTQCVIDIRRALGDDEQQMIRTVHGRGFIFELPVTLREPAVDAMPVTVRRRPLDRWRVHLLALAGLVIVVVGWWGLGERVEDGAPDPQTPPSFAQVKSIAVLPFLDLSPERDQAYFADGLAEEVLHQLAQSPKLRVAARTSSFAFRESGADISSIASELGVAYVLEGSVRRVGDQVRVTAQLVDAATNSHILSRAYDRSLVDILSVQRDVATDVAAAMQIALTPMEILESPARAEAQVLFLRGRHLYNRRGPGDVDLAQQYFEQALDRDPEHARAWTALAGVYRLRYVEWISSNALEGPRDMSGIGADGSDNGMLVKQRHALERALVIDPGLAEAHVRMCYVLTLMGEDEAASTSFQRAASLAPSDPFVLAALAGVAAGRGDIEDAVEYQRRAVELDPLSVVAINNYGILLMASGRLDEALEQLRKARELNQDADIAFDLSRGLLLQGKREEALRESASVVDPPRRDQLRVLLDEQSGAAAALGRLRSDASGSSRVLLAEIAAYRGDTDEAMRRVEEVMSAERGNDPAGRLLWRRNLKNIHISPFLRPLHEDQRWKQLIARLP